VTIGRLLAKAWQKSALSIQSRAFFSLRSFFRNLQDSTWHRAMAWYVAAHTFLSLPSHINSSTWKSPKLHFPSTSSQPYFPSPHINDLFHCIISFPFTSGTIDIRNCHKQHILKIAVGLDST
jgi:hypothetical protein